MGNKRDYYEVLGVSKTADEAAIKNWPKNTILIQMQGIPMQSRSLRRLQKHILF